MSEPPRTRHIESIRKTVKKIKPLSEFNPYVKAIAYGPQGSGKTKLASTAPNVLIIDMNEQGTRSAAAGKGSGINVTAWEEIPDLYWWLRGGKHDYEAVSLDTLTGMQGLCMAFVMQGSKLAAPSKREYGQTGVLMSGMITAFRNLPMHVIFTAQVRSIRDEDDDETIAGYTVDLPASSRNTALAGCGIIGYMSPKLAKSKATGKKVFVDQFITEPDSMWYTKVRPGVDLETPLINPTVPALIEAWQKKGK